MAVTKTYSLWNYRGLSTDSKPTVDPHAPSVPIYIGSTFIETDTGKFYVWNGTSWVLINP